MMFLLLILMLSSVANGATIVVPDNALTIQGGVAAAATGDTVLVRPGTYLENVNYLGRGIILRSLGGPATTIIDGSAGGTSVIYMRDVPGAARLEGFTLRGGGGSPTPFERQGGGVCVRDSLVQDGGLGPLIRNNWIVGNHATRGGGIFIDGICRVTNNRIYLNESEGSGGGIARGDAWVLNSNPRVVSDNEIFSNRVTRPDRSGGGAAITGTSAGRPFQFLRNVVACNDAGRGGGVYATMSAGGTFIENNTIVMNSASYLEAGGMRLILADNGGVLVVSGNVIAYNVNGGVRCVPDIGAPPPDMDCNDVYGNLPDFVDGECGLVIGARGNFSADPLFGHLVGCPPTTGDLCLSDESPLLP